MYFLYTLVFKITIDSELAFTQVMAWYNIARHKSLTNDDQIYRHIYALLSLNVLSVWKYIWRVGGKEI